MGGDVQTGEFARTCDDRGPGSEFGHPPLEPCGKPVDAQGQHPGGHRGEPCPDRACSAVSERTCRYPGWRMCIHPPPPGDGSADNPIHVPVADFVQRAVLAVRDNLPDSDTP